MRAALIRQQQQQINEWFLPPLQLILFIYLLADHRFLQHQPLDPGLEEVASPGGHPGPGAGGGHCD